MSTKPNQEYQLQNNGFVLVALMIICSFILALGLVTAQLGLSNLRLATVETYRINAQFAADAGLDSAIQNLNADETWTGSGGEVTLLSNSVMKSTYNTAVTNDTDPGFKYVDVTARTYVPATNSTPRIERKFQVKLRGVGGGSFSVVTGVGGLVMSNNSKIVGGNVYVNGTIGLNNSAQIGLTSNPVEVKAAHQSCPSPADGTYPKVCASGENGQPISVNSTNAKIYGEVQGTNQTDGTGMYTPGLVVGSPPPLALPTHDRDAQKAAVATTITGASTSCNNGTQTWAANTKITGDVTISNKCEVTVLGDVWITGTLTFNGSAKIIVGNGITTPPVIMIDGAQALVMRNSAVFTSNAVPTGFRVISYYSRASCSPDCGNVTGTDLYNTRNDATIDLDNSSSGPNTEFYGRWSKVLINNSGNLGALVAQTVELRNSATVVFGTPVSGVSGYSAWVVEYYKRSF
jgi:hypothetical protein